jgi:hypothetical protein
MPSWRSYYRGGLEDNPNFGQIEMEDMKLASFPIELYLAELHRKEAELEDINTLRHHPLHTKAPPANAYHARPNAR